MFCLIYEYLLKNQRECPGFGKTFASTIIPSRKHLCWKGSIGNEGQRKRRREKPVEPNRESHRHAKRMRLYWTEHLPLVPKSFHESAAVRNMVRRWKARAKTVLYACGKCQKQLDGGSYKHLSLCCNVCGSVQCNCSGLATVSDKRYCRDCFFVFEMFEDVSFGTSNSRNSLLQKATQLTALCCQNTASLGILESLELQSNFSYNETDNFLRKGGTYIKFKQAHRNFKWLKVQRFRLNEIWSVDLADMQQFSNFNQSITFLFVAVDTLSRFLWVFPLQRKTATACRQAVKDNIESLTSGDKVY